MLILRNLLFSCFFNFNLRVVIRKNPHLMQINELCYQNDHSIL